MAKGPIATRAASDSSAAVRVDLAAVVLALLRSILPDLVAVCLLPWFVFGRSSWAALAVKISVAVMPARDTPSSPAKSFPVKHPPNNQLQSAFEKHGCQSKTTRNMV
jgi:hypothetical protein